MIDSKDMAAVARTIELVAENPPQNEGWDTQGQGTLESNLRNWLKEKL